MMKTASFLLIIVLYLVFVLPVSAGETPIRHACEINKGTCVGTTVDGAYEVSFSIEPKPVTAMRELTFRVVLKEQGVRSRTSSVTIDLSMPGMYMGKNRVALTPHDGVYEGTGIIIRCPSGKKTWQADVAIQASDKKSNTGFIFEVQ